MQNINYILGAYIIWNFNLETLPDAKIQWKTGVKPCLQKHGIWPGWLLGMIWKGLPQRVILCWLEACRICWSEIFQGREVPRKQEKAKSLASVRGWPECELFWPNIALKPNSPLLNGPWQSQKKKQQTNPMLSGKKNSRQQSQAGAGPFDLCVLCPWPLEGALQN